MAVDNLMEMHSRNTAYSNNNNGLYKDNDTVFTLSTGANAVNLYAVVVNTTLS